MTRAAPSDDSSVESESSMEGKQMLLAQLLRLLRSRRIVGGPAENLRLVRSDRCSGFIAGGYELPVQEQLCASLRPGDVFFDVGANIGFFTALGSKLVGESGSVFAFEPIPENVSLIRRNLAINDIRNVTVIQKAVTDSQGISRIWITAHPGGATLASVGTVPPDALKQVEIQTVSLDNCSQIQDLVAVRLVKIDVEGGELAVLRGMAYLLKKFQPIVLIELDALDDEVLTQKVDDVTAFLIALGYTVRRMPDAYTNRDYKVVHLLAN